MKKLRLLIIALLIWMAIFFNIERLDLGVENVIDISTFVYILGLVAVISIVAVRSFHRYSVSIPIGLWVGIFLISKMLLGRPLLGGIYTYLSITELSFLLISVWLAYQLASALYEFEEAIERITFTENTNKRVQKLEEAYDEIQIEIFRSRHHHHPMSIIVVEPVLEAVQTSLHSLVQEVQEAMMNSYVINNMAHTLSKYIRRTDFVLEQRERGRFIILCPETNAADLDLMVEYVQAVAKEQLGAPITYGTATFPDEAITFEELLHKAESQLNGLKRNGRNEKDDSHSPYSLSDTGINSEELLDKAGSLPVARR
jgi:hypothetical protein